MNCPICTSTQTKYFAEKDRYTFYRCNNCIALFLTTLPSQKRLEHYYAKQFSYRDGLLNESSIRKRSRVILKKIKQLAPSANTISDVGSGYGFFLDESQKNGFNVFGVEPAKQLARHAEKYYSIHTFLGTLEEYVCTTHKQFDVVTCIHVIEHIPHPREFIRALFKLVKKGGILYIETPNSDSHLLSVEKEKYTFLIPPEHVWVFSLYSIRHLLPPNTNILYINIYSYSEHLMGIIKSLLHRCKQRYSPQNTSIIRIIEVNESRSIRHFILKDINMLKKIIFYRIFDRILAPLFTSLLNLYHKGSILGLYIKKKK